MPNTKPPLTTLAQLSAYRDELISAGQGALLDIIVPLYLNANTTSDLIAQGAQNGTLKAAKYYPPHGTTGAEHGAPLQTYIDNGVFQAMQDHGVTLCIHGEEHALEAETYFDRSTNAEEVFYQTRMPDLIKKFPTLKIVAEHLTTKAGVDFVHNAPPHIKATVTPQHLLYTVGHLLKGLQYHLYCLPLLKFEEDRAALRAAVTADDNTKFFAGTDSAPHTQKCTPCGCAAGCYTGGIAPQLYAQGFEAAGVDLATDHGAKAFQRFLCDIGPDFYGLPTPQDSFTLTKMPHTITPIMAGDQQIIPLPLGIEGADGQTSTTIPWSII